jgi:hypothetical protein
MTLSVSRRQALGGSAGLLLSGTGPVKPGVAASHIPATFDREQLTQDLQFWYHQVLSRHPRYHGQDRLEPAAETAFRDALDSCRDGMSRRAAFRLIAGLNPIFRDAHTLILPWISGQEPTPAEARVQFPFGVNVVPAGGLVLRSAWRHADTGQSLAAGTPITTINWMPSSDLISQLQRFSHGETEQLRTHMLSVMMPAWLNAAFGWQGVFEVELASSGDTTRILWTPEERWLPQETAPPDLPQLSWPLPDLAVLKVPTFDVDEDPSAFERAVDASFAAIRARRAAGLVIDVRGNTGGQSDAGAAIIRQLLDRPVVQVSRARERLNEDNIGQRGDATRLGQIVEFDLGEEAIEPVAPENRFGGPVVVLVDELTYSAGILFATTMQDHRLAILVGRPTGGFANQTGNMMPSRLPNTGFTGFIATREFVRPNGDLRQQPVMPDILVEGEPTAAQLAGFVQEARRRFGQAGASR